MLTIAICSKKAVADQADKGYNFLISLEDPGTPKETPAWLKDPAAHFQQHFHDFTKRDLEHGLGGFKRPTAKHVRELVALARWLVEQGKTNDINCLVHCHAGISRSPAVAFIIMAVLHGEGHERDAFKEVFLAAPLMWPSDLLVELADNALGRKGAMVRELERFTNHWNDSDGPFLVGS